MIEFKKKIKDLLPYDRKQYKLWKNWYGVSFQLPGVFEGKDIGLKVFHENYYNWFKNIISKLDNGAPWIVNHDFIDQDWFPNNENNLKPLRNLFKENGISNTFKGALIFNKNDILKYAKELISYPYAVINRKNRLYNNLDISNSELPIIIKISGHLTIDLLSTDIEFLRKIVNDNAESCFVIIETNGTSL